MSSRWGPAPREAELGPRVATWPDHAPEGSGGPALVSPLPPGTSQRFPVGRSLTGWVCSVPGCPHGCSGLWRCRCVSLRRRDGVWPATSGAPLASGGGEQRRQAAQCPDGGSGTPLRSTGGVGSRTGCHSLLAPPTLSGAGPGPSWGQSLTCLTVGELAGPGHPWTWLTSEGPALVPGTGSPQPLARSCSPAQPSLLRGWQRSELCSLSL